MGFFSQTDESAEKQKRIEQMQQEYRDMGRVTGKLFYIMIATIALGVVNGIFSVAGLGGLHLCITIVATALDILFGVLILFMPRAEDRFRMAGICFILAEVGALIQLPGGDVAIIGKIVEAIFSLIAIFTFVPEMETRIAPVNGDIELSWDNFLKLYAVCLAAPVLSAILALAGLITVTFYNLVTLAIIVASLVLLVWQTILLRDSATAFSGYTYTESSPHPGRRSARRNASGKPGKDEWKCTCGQINPNFLGTCSCGVKKSEARAADEKRQALVAEKEAKESAAGAKESTSGEN